MSGLIYLSKGGNRNFREGIRRLKQAHWIAAIRYDRQAEINAAFDIGLVGYKRITSRKSGISKTEVLSYLKSVWVLIPQTEKGQKAKTMYDEIMQTTK